jgi:hypothetical protein
MRATGGAGPGMASLSHPRPLAGTQNTGTRPLRTMACVVDAKVNGVVMTSPPAGRCIAPIRPDARDVGVSPLINAQAPTEVRGPF